MEASLRALFEFNQHYKRQITEALNANKLSKLYIACQDGDVNTVRTLLPTIRYHQLNRFECNGSTPLHIATIRGHSEIVRLLLHDYCCQRHLRDNQGLTAYDQASNEEIRRLFYRPSNINRFNEDEEIISQSEATGQNDASNVLTKPDRIYLIGFEANEDIPHQLNGLNGIKAMFQSRLGRFIMETGMKLKLAKDTGYTDEEYAYVTSRKFREDALRKLIDEHVTSNHREYQHCYYLFNEYIEHDTIESLLKLYTLETPFYKQLMILSSPLGFPFFMHLTDLKKRYFQGYTYRGLRLSEHKLNEYRWALKHPNSVLCIMTFSSTSIDRHVAEKFSSSRLKPSQTISTLLIYHFSQPCDTAINLSGIPRYHLPCISNYENEKEVLIAPRTFFQVTDIQFNQSTNRCTIHLENLCGEHQNVVQALTLLLKNDLKKKM